MVGRHEFHGAAAENVGDGTKQAIAEVRQPGADQADRARQGLPEELFRAGRTVSRIAGDCRLRGGMTRGKIMRNESARRWPP